MINIDWLNIAQVHPSAIDADGVLVPALPVVCSGLTCKFTKQSAETFIEQFNGACLSDVSDLAEWAVQAHQVHEGSFDSRLILRSDGCRVDLRGNVSRFGRPDNVFTGDFARAIECANNIVAEYGLPPFTSGDYREFRNDEGDLKHEYTGATVSMLHLNRKYSAGSPEKAQRVLDWARHQSLPHVTTSTRGNSVYYGSKKSNRKLIKLYDKAQEMLEHAKEHGRSKEEVLNDPVYQYCLKNGILCLELEARRLMLADRNMRFLGEITMEKITRLFDEEAAILFDRVTVSDASDVALFDVCAGAKMAALAWLRGENPLLTLADRTGRRYTKELEKYGIDLRHPLDPENPRPPAIVQVVEVTPVTEAPAWYWDYQARMVAEAVNADPYQAEQEAA